MKKIFKKTLSISSIVLAVILATLIILFISAYSKRGAFSQINLFSGNQQVIEAQNKDSDNDGLNDWQENLFKTDPNNPDTDADTYLDGEEVNSGHNPLVKAPGDEQVFYPLPLGEKYNLTKKVLSDETIDSIINSYLAQKKQYIDEHPSIDSQEAFSATVKPSTVQEMMKEALGETYSTLTDKASEEIMEMPEIFNITVDDNDIKISEDNSRQTVEAYIKKVKSFLNTDVFFLKEEASNAVTLAADSGDFSQLDSLIQTNDAMLEEIKTIEVPSTWKDIHKEGLRLTLILRNIYVSFRDILNDPLKAYIAADKLGKIPEQWNELMSQAVDLGASQGIQITIQK